MLEAANEAMNSMDMPTLLALAAALGWASGLKLYLVVFVMGVLGYGDWLDLPNGLSVLEHPAMLAGSGFMLFAELFADKIPGFDSIWDAVNSFIRVPAGAALAAAAFGADSATMTAVMALMGGTLAVASNATKASTRAAINTSPEPFSNVAASVTEDGLALGAVGLALYDPWLFAAALVVVLLLSGLLVWAMFRFLRGVIKRLRRWAKPTASAPETAKSLS